MIWAVNRSRADIWFQGEHQKIAFESLVKPNNRNRLKVLNAVLGVVPRSDHDTILFDLVFVGRITVEKGLFELVEALSILRESNINLTLNIVGAGPYLDKLEEFVKQHKLESTITFSGYVSSAALVAKHITQAKLFILPSYTEGLPRAMVESMYLETPVMVTSVGGIPFVIEHRKNGFIIEPQSTESLVQSLEEFFVTYEHNRAFLHEICISAKNEARKYTFSERGKYFLNSAGI